NHLNSSQGSFPSLISVLQSGSFERLLRLLGSEHAETHRNARFHGDACQPFRDFGGDVIEMRCISSDDGSETDNGIERFRIHNMLRYHGEFKAAGAEVHIVLIVCCAVAFEAIDSAFNEAAC